MTSPQKIEANRRNALRSTGPRTARGKAVASKNALRHGLLSQAVCLPDEDEAALVEYGGRLRAELRPVGELEALLVDRIVSLAWRLRRVGRVETGLFAFRQYDTAHRKALAEAARYSRNRDREMEELLSVAAHGRTEITDKTRHDAAIAEVRATAALRDGAGPSTARAFAEDEATFSNLCQYEAALERSLYRALHELQRRQAQRAGQPVPPPLAVDLDLSLSHPGQGPISISNRESEETP